MSGNLCKRLICLFMALIMLLGGPLEVLANGGGVAEASSGGAVVNMPTPKDYGPFKNVTHTLTLDEGHEALCYRNLTGEIKFDWPEPSTYVDLVFIQDFSGSFKDTIQQVGGAVKEMINSLNMGVDIDGKSPKDRAMVIGYRGVMGDMTVYEGGYTESQNFPGDYLIFNSNLTGDKNNIKQWVTSQYISSTAKGGTPTVDGLFEAHKRYSFESRLGAGEYNKEEYTIAGQPRKRKTVYVLITDGVANAARWDYLPDKARQELNIHPYYVPGEYSGTQVNRSFLWIDDRNYPDGTVYSSPGRISRTEAYRPMLTGMVDLAAKMRATGGVNGSKAQFLSAFWEDSKAFNTYYYGYGQRWDTHMRAVVVSKLQEMTGNNPDYFATASSHIDQFSQKLVKAFKATTSAITDQVKLEANADIMAKEYQLLKKQADGSYSSVLAGDTSAVAGQHTVIDMESMESGSYKIVYKLTENKVEQADYSNPAPKFTFEGKEQVIGTAEDGNIPIIPKNNRTECNIKILKSVAINKLDYPNKDKYKLLEYRRQPFNYDTVYSLTAKVREAKESIVLLDDIDSRLDVLDAFLIAGNDAANADAVTGATPNSTLIAELKGYGNNDHAGVPGLTIEGNKVSYSLPKKPATISGTAYDFGGYSGKEYILVVKAKIKDTVTDEQIQDMRTPNPIDGKPTGVHNVAKLKLDHEEILSNVARAVPPPLQYPEIKKYIALKAAAGVEEVWLPAHLELENKKDPFRYRIELDMPTDTTGFTKLLVTDKLDVDLEIDGIANLSVYYMDTGGNRTVLNASQYTASFDTSTNKLTVNLIEGSATETLFEAMANKKLSVEFPVKIKAGFNMAEKYDAKIKRIVIPNTSSYILNERAAKYSNEVELYVPLASVVLMKYMEDGSTGLSGAEFTLTDTTDTNISPRVLESDANGKVSVESLVPGRVYNLKETKAPEGYMLDDNNSWTITVSNYADVTIKGGPDNSVVNGGIVAKNIKPVVPKIEKWLKGESQSEFKQPTRENPYIPLNNSETITYQLRVPVEDSNGYHKLEITDIIDHHLHPIPGSLKVFIKESPETPLNVNYTMTGRTFKIVKSTGFNALNGKTMVIEVQARVEDKISNIYTTHSDGKIPNKAELKLNDSEAIVSNEVFIQPTDGKVKLKKTISDTTGANTVDMASGLTAGFSLYKVVNTPDPISTGGEKNDVLVDNYTITGSEILKVENLGPGTYYFLETSPPKEHLKHEGMIPNNNGFVIAATGGVVEVGNQPFVVDNKKADVPTIKKKVKGDKRPEYSSETYPIGIGEVWKYALDITIPTTAEDIAYKVVDDIPAPFEIRDIKVFSQEATATNWPTTEDTLIKSYLAPYNYSNPNHIELNLPVGAIASYRGKVVRVEVSVRVKPGTNLLDSGALDAAGLIPNNVSLIFGTTTINSTVNVDPTILRDINFTKKAGSDNLSGALFKLHKYNTDGSMGAPVIEPFTGSLGEEYTATSDYNGKVSFKNVPEGTYWMVETPPKGYLVKNEKIKVIVGGTTATSPITFQDEHGIHINSTIVYNNELVKISGIKAWDDNYDEFRLRPEEIKVKLYRKLGENGDAEFMDTKTIKKPWLYVFQDEGDSKKLLKYEPNSNVAYTYFVEEEPVKYYSTKVDGYDVTNKIEQLSFRIIKRDGDKVAANEPNSAIKGTTFVLESTNGERQEVVSNDLGIMQFDNVKKGLHYRLWEKSTAISENYIYNSGVVNVFINNEGKPEFHPDKFPLIDPDNNAETDNSGYLFLNYQQATPVKKIKVGNELLDEYKLKEHHETVTYQIKYPVKGIADINVLEITDQVDPSMQVFVGSGKVFADGVDISDKFTIETTGESKIKRFTIERVSGNLSAIENKTLTFEFNAKIAMSPSGFSQRPEGLKVHNKAVLNINNRPENKKETNVVTIESQFTELKATKKLGHQDGTITNLTSGQSATFTLEKVGIVGYPTRTIKTDANGKINLENLDTGLCRLTEIKAPEGYLPVEPIYFKVVNDAGTLKIYKSNAEGTVGTEISGGDYGDIVDPLPEIPTINKMVRAKNTSITAEGGDYKNYTMNTWKETFDYVVEVKLPENINGYKNVSFKDILPVGLDVPEPYTVFVKVGTGVGADFVPDADQNPYASIKAGTEVEQLVSTHQYEVEFNSSDEDLIKSLAGKTIQWVYDAKINDKFNSISQLTLTNGYFENTAIFSVNNEIKVDSLAKVKPVEQYGMVLKKVADFKNPDGTDVPLKDATFVLEKYSHNGVEGPNIPEGMQVEYVTGVDGLMTLDKRLEDGKYIITERYYPNSYTGIDGTLKFANFAAVYNHYLLEVGTKLANGTKGIRITGMYYDWSLATTPVYEGPSPTAEAPGKIVNKQYVFVPVTKVWNDDDNKHLERPETLEFLVQRAVVNGEPDKLDPKTGKLKPDNGDSADTVDAAFNQAALLNAALKIKVNIASLPVFFNSSLLVKYNDDGKLYNYYVLETVPEGYEATYKRVPTESGFDEKATKETVEVTNALKKVLNFTVLKQDDSTPPVKLEGAEFNLRHVDMGDAAIVETIKTNSNGLIALTGILTNKTYTLKETKAPTGYQMDATEYTIFSDNKGVPKVYSKYIAPNDPGNVEVDSKQFVVTPATETETAKYQLIVTNKKLELPTPVKKINGADSFNLPSLSTEFEYTVEVPVKSTEGMTGFILEDTVHELLEIVSGSGTVTADTKPVSTTTNLTVEGKKITFNMTEGFENIANRTVKLSFKAKIATGVTMEQLKSFMAVPENNAGIPNEATLKINDKSMASNKVHLVPGNAGEAPELDKKVNSQTHYDLKELKEEFNYKVLAKVPENILGYNSLVIKDTMAKVLEINGGIKLTLLSADTSTKPLEINTDYNLTNAVDTTGKTVITASFVDGFDYTKIAGKTVVMEFSAKIKSTATAEELAAYTDSKIPNKVTIKLNNNLESEEKIVTITPPSDPTIDKKVNGEDNIILDATGLTENITYTINCVVPLNVKGMNKLQISDTINGALNVETAVATVDGAAQPEIVLLGLSPFENPVRATISGNENIAKFAGKTIKLIITAKVDSTKNLSEHLTEGKLLNTAEVKVNDQVKAKDTANITLKLGQVSLKKTLSDNPTVWPTGKKAVFRLEKEVGTSWDEVKNIEITGFEPVVINELIPGKYRFVETTTPYGYVAASPVEFTITGSEVATQEIVIANRKSSITKTVDKGFFEDFTSKRTYTVTVPLGETISAERVEVLDKLNSLYEQVDSITTKVNGADVNNVVASYDETNHAIRLLVTGKEALSTISNKSVVITYTVKLKDGFKYEDLPTDYKLSGIPNTVDLIIDDKAVSTSEKVYVKVSVGSVTLIKKAAGGQLPVGTSATFELYQQIGAAPTPTTDTKLGVYATVNIGGSDKITVNNLKPGKYYFIETAAPHGYVINTTPREFEVVVDANTGIVSVNAGTGFTNFTVNNIQSNIPIPIKKVGEQGGTIDKDNLYLGSWTQVHSYKINLEVPALAVINNWTKFILTDPVDKDLQIELPSVKVTIGTEEYTLASQGNADRFEVTEDNVIAFEFKDKAKIDAMAGKTVTLTFNANVKDMGESDFIAKHSDGKIHNSAHLELNLQGEIEPSKSNSTPVWVAPPFALPSPTKSIDGDAQGAVTEPQLTKSLSALDQDFYYEIRTKVPMNLADVNKIKLSDELASVLELIDNKVNAQGYYTGDNIRVYVDDIFIPRGQPGSLNDFVKFDKATNTISMEINKDPSNPDALKKGLEGKVVRMEFKVKFRGNVTTEELAHFLKTEGPLKGSVIVPNNAYLQIDDKAPISTNTVNVTPPGDEPTIAKAVEGNGTSSNNAEKTNLMLGAKGDEFTYKVAVKVPPNVNNSYKNLNISDTLEDVLEIVGIPTINLADGTAVPGITATPTVSNNTVSFKFPVDDPETSHVNEGYDYAQIAGKTVVLTIVAKIKDSVTLDQIAQSYGNSALPNEGVLNFNGKTMISNRVKVTPPSDIVAPTKTVNAQNDIVLENIKDEFVYNINYKIPTNITGFNKLTLKDTLETALETYKTKITVYVDDQKDEKLTNAISKTEQEIGLTINKGFLGGIFGNAFGDLAGKTIRIEIKARIKDGADLSTYTDKSIPNKASLQLNDKPAVESNTVTVKPSKGSVILTKVVDGEPLSAEQTATFKLYKQSGVEPSEHDVLVQINGTDEATVNEVNNKITVSGLEPGNYYFKETQAPKGYTLNDSPIKFEITADQAIALALTWNNISDLTAVKTVNDAKTIDIKNFSEEFTYKISIPVGSISAIKKLVIKDQVNPLLTIITGSAKAYKQDGTTITGNTAIDSNTITFTKTTSFNEINNNIITLEFKAKIKDDITLTELETGSILTTGIPNKAGLTINDKKEVETDTVYVKPILGDVELTKTAEGKPLSTGQNAKFDLYKGTTPSGTKIGQTQTTDANGKITTTNLIPGNYYFIETQAPEGYKLDNTPKTFTIYGGEKTKINPVEVKIDNKQAETPTPIKTVNNTKEITLTTLNQEFTYKIAVPVGDVNGITNLVIKDLVDDFISIINGSAKVTIDTVATTGTVEEKEQSITYTANTADIEAMANKTVTLEFKAKIKEGTTYEKLIEKYADLSIPNKASLKINDKKEIETNTVKVTPEFGKVTLTKTSEGQPLPEGISAVFSLYRVSSTGDVFIKNYQTVNGKIEILNLSQGKYYFKEKTAPAGHILDESKREFTVNADASTTAGTNFTDFTVDNKTPKDGPTVNKKVDGKDHKDLTNLTDEFTYTVKVTVPHKVDGYESLVIEDQVDPLLTITGKSVAMAEGSTYTLLPTDGNLTDIGSIVKYTFTNGFDYTKVAGQTIVMTIKAKVKDGVTVNQISEIYKDNKIPNTAKLVFNNTATNSNTVTVTVPGETPVVSKDVEGETNLNLGTLDQEFKYNVKVNVPTNTQGYKKLELVDTLESVLQVVQVEVQVAGIKNTDLTGKVVQTGNEVKLSLDGTYDYSQIAGKLVNLIIKAKIKDGEDLAPFINKGVPNKASLEVNNNPKVETDVVTVTPPGEGPSVKKEISSNSGQVGTDSLILNSGAQNFFYRVVFHIPANVEGYKTIVIEDQLEKVLQVPTSDKILLSTLEGSTNSYITGRLKGEAYVVDGQKVKLILSKETFGENFGFTNLAGKKVVMEFPVSIKAGADLSEYANGEILNTATLSFNGVPKTSNNVKVVPPAETPTPKIDINGALSKTIEDKAENFTYNISYKVPNNLNGITSIELNDILKSVLETKADKVTIKANNTAYVGGTKTYDPATNKVGYKLSVEELEALKGQEIVVSIVTNIKADADLSAYANNTIPNKAELTVNDNAATKKETGEVLVILDGKVTIPVEKTWEGAELNAVTLYVVAAENQVAADTMTIANAVKTLNLAKTTGWMGSFEGLAKYNDKGSTISYFVKEEIPAGYTNEITRVNGKVTVKNIAPAKTTAKVQKVWSGGSEASHIPVEIQLYRQAEGGNKEYVGAAVSLNKGNIWTHTWTDLSTLDALGKAYIYTVDEPNVPAGYSKTIESVASETNSFKVTNTYGVTTGDIKAYKKWVGGDSLERPSDIFFQLMKDGLPEGDRKPLGTETEITWTNMPLMKEDSTPIVYSVKELNSDGTDWVNENYTVSYNGLVVTNTYSSETRDVYAKKIWTGGTTVSHVEPKFELYRNGIKVDGVVPTVTKKDDSSEYYFKWSGLSVKDIYGQVFNYSVVETGAYDNYGKSVVTGDGSTVDTAFTITNTYGAPTTTHSFTKTWVNGPTTKPTIKIRLYQNGKEYETQVALANGMTNYQWTHLPNTDENGKDYVYTVKEVAVGSVPVENGKAGDYTVNEVDNGTSSTITNTYVLPKIDLEGQKTWVGDGESTRPENITVELLRNNNPLEPAVTITTDATKEWKYKFTDLDKTDNQGNVYTYTVREREVPVGYTVAYNGMDIINTYSDKVTIPVSKTWKYADGTEIAQDNIPSAIDKVFVVLYRNEESTAVKELTKENSWKTSFEELEKFDLTGTAYRYKVEELPVDGFVGTVTTNAEGSVSIVNKKKDTPTMTIPVQKLWSGEKPTDITSITVELTREIEGTIDTEFKQTLNISGPSWKGEFTGLPREDKDAKKYTYKVEERPVAGYNAAYTGGGACGFVIHNEPTTVTTLTLNKTEENTNTPLAGAEFELRGKTNPSYSQKATSDAQGKVNFAKIQYGEYQLTETKAPVGYEQSTKVWTVKVDREGNIEITGTSGEVENNPLTITNKKTEQPDPETIKIKAHKIWVNLDPGEDPNKYEATFILKPTDTEQTIKGNGVVTFDNLPKYNSEGMEIKYSVEEKPIKGFSTLISGNATEGFVFANYPTNKFGIVLQKIDKDTKAVLAAAEFQLWKTNKTSSTTITETAETIAANFKLETEKARLEELLSKKEEETIAEERSKKIAEIEEKLNSEENRNTKEKIKQLQSEKTQLETEKETLKTSIEPTDLETARIAEIEERLETIEKEILQTNTELEKLNKELEKLNTELEANNAMNTEIETLKKSIEELEKNTNTTTLAERNNTRETETLIGTYTTDKNGLITIGELEAGNYYFKETKAPVGYKEDYETKYELTVPETTSPSKPVSITVENEKINIQPETTEYTAHKQWIGAPHIKPTIKIQLLQNGQKYGEAITLQNGELSYTWSNLPKHDNNENQFIYSIKELEIPEGYTSETNGNTITNTKDTTPPTPADPEYTTITGEKIWLGDNETERPKSIKVKLINAITNQLVQEKNVTAETNWHYTFEKILLKDNNGTYTYKIEEEVLIGYSVRYNGYNIINTKDTTPITPVDPEYTTITGEKIWLGDNETERPKSIKVKLINAITNQLVQEENVTAETNWHYTFEKILLKDNNGTYTYKIEEEVPIGYSVRYNGYNIINTKDTTPITPITPANPGTPITPVDPVTPVASITPVPPTIPEIPPIPTPTTQQENTKETPEKAPKAPKTPKAKKQPKEDPKSVNPKTLVKGYTTLIIALITTIIVLIFADMKRRKAK